MAPDGECKKPLLASVLNWKDIKRYNRDSATIQPFADKIYLLYQKILIKRNLRLCDKHIQYAIIAFVCPSPLSLLNECMRVCHIHKNYNTHTAWHPIAFKHKSIINRKTSQVDVLTIFKLSLMSKIYKVLREEQQM